MTAPARGSGAPIRVLGGIEAARPPAGPGAAEPMEVLVVTTFDLDEYVYEALRAGASGFLPGDPPPHDLVDGIRTVAVGESLLSPAVTRRLVGRSADRVRRPPPPRRCPPRHPARPRC